MSPTYCYFCPRCGASLEEHHPIAEADIRPLCLKCNLTMNRDFRAEHPRGAGIQPIQAAYKDFWGPVDEELGHDHLYRASREMWRDRVKDEKKRDAPLSVPEG